MICWVPSHSTHFTLQLCPSHIVCRHLWYLAHCRECLFVSIIQIYLYNVIIIQCRIFVCFFFHWWEVDVKHNRHRNFGLKMLLCPDINNVIAKLFNLLFLFSLIHCANHLRLDFHLIFSTVISKWFIEISIGKFVSRKRYCSHLEQWSKVAYMFCRIILLVNPYPYLGIIHVTVVLIVQY